MAPAVAVYSSKDCAIFFKHGRLVIYGIHPQKSRLRKRICYLIQVLGKDMGVDIYLEHATASLNKQNRIYTIEHCHFPKTPQIWVEAASQYR